MPQDFSGQNLRGRSFKGQNLGGANFSGADIRSADFTGANLRNANFSHATAGLQKRWVIGLILISCLISAISGTFLGIFGLVAVNIFTSRLEDVVNTSFYANFTAGIVSLVILIAFCIITIHQGILAGLGILAMAIAMAAASLLKGAMVSAGIFGIFFILLAVTIAIAFVGSGVIAITGTINIAGVKAVYINIFASGLVIFTVVASTTGIGAAVATVTMPVAVAIFISYIGWLALKGDKKNAWVCSSAIAFGATGGTSFRGADLTNVNFTAATLKSTDFRKAILTRTCFNKTQKLDHVRPGTTYLQKAQVVSVLVKGQGQDKNFDREDLRGVNFQGANLVDTSFIGADLSEANLKDADLSRAKLVQAQLNGTDLTGATLTGTYIQDWGITTNTKFDGVRCEYVYMRLPTKENPDPLRKPDNHKEVFADGEFGDFIQPIFDTLDLYHNQDVDPRAIAISFKQLAENHPDAELEIVAMEKRGQDKFLLRAKTAGTADKSELSAEYFDTYNEIKALPEREIKLLLAEKDNQIRRLENMVMTALERPNFYSSTQIQEVGSMNSNQGGINQSANNSQFGQGQQAAQGDGSQLSMGNNENYKTKYDQSHANIGGFVDTAQSGSQQTFNQNISAPEQKRNLTEAAAEIQQLLEQLSQSYPTNTMAGKMALAAEATQRIENNPTLMQKTISALRAGGTAALEQVLSHPAASFVIAALDDWNKNSQ